MQMKRNANRLVLRWFALVYLLLAVDVMGLGAAAPQTVTADVHPGDLLRRARRILFLGDSITYSGQYVVFFDAWLQTQRPTQTPPPVVINAGLPSETVSGLSEEGHAGGRFPRPDLAERLVRVLDVTQPDLVFACYGINCGIYQPLDAQRFQRYRQGIRHLHQAVEARDAVLVLVTPPFYDDQRAGKPFSYNAVLDRYSQWLVEQRDRGWLVIDLHAAMTEAVRRRRVSDPAFTFQRDAVHPDTEGHWCMAQPFLRWCGDERAADSASAQAMLSARSAPEGVLDLVRRRCHLRRDAYLSAAGHRRPGIKSGLPVAQAELQADAITRQIQALLKSTASR